jgi:hypothetical protein
MVSGVEQGKQCASLPLYDWSPTTDYVDKQHHERYH